LKIFWIHGMYSTCMYVGIYVCMYGYNTGIELADEELSLLTNV